MTALELDGVVKHFGGVTAVDGVSLILTVGEIVGLIGPNGAGKTTLFDCVTGHTRPDAGRVRLAGRDVTDLPVEERARAGLGRTFQQLAVFETMTVADHLLLAAEHAGRRVTSDPRRTAARLLERLRLGEYADVRTADLPTGTLRRVEIARAVATGARFLLLDEPASGLDVGQVTELTRMLAELRAGDPAARGLLLVEHDVRFVENLADRLAVMHSGRILAEGPPAAVVADRKVQAAYLSPTRPAGAGPRGDVSAAGEDER